MANVEESTNIIKEPKKRGRKPHLNADGLPLSDEENKNNEHEIQQTEFTKIIFIIGNYKKHVIMKGKRLNKKCWKINFLI